MTGQMLRGLRESAGLSIREVARRSNGKTALSNGHLSLVERGLREVTPATVAVYERALGIYIDRTGGGLDEIGRAAEEG